MDSLITAFHLDLKLLIAQLVNFAIVFLVLYFLVFKPLFKTTGERSATIAKSLKEAKEIEERLAKSKEEHKQILKEAKTEAAKIVEEAALKADLKKNELVAKAKEEIGQIINAEKEKLEREKAATLKEIRQEVANLFAASWQKILKEKMDKTMDEKIISKIVSHLK